MSTIKKGTITRAHEWAVHLRPFGKRMFWHRERQAAKSFAVHAMEQYDTPEAERAMAEVDDYYQQKREEEDAKQNDGR
jgi:hypothetical protein